jgi:predicted RNA-binding protein YlxR (DUF448 family)
VGCRKTAPRSSLLRIVAVPGADGAPARLQPDPGRVLPGRGASLHLDERCLVAAERRRAFSRALRIEGPVDLTLVVEHLATVMQRCPTDDP